VEGTDRDRRRQAQRYRFDRRSLCSGLPGQSPYRRALLAGLVGGCADPLPLPRIGWWLAGCPRRRPGGTRGVLLRRLATQRARRGNASAVEYQDLVADGRPLYRHVAARLRQWADLSPAGSGYSHVGAVVGATYPGQLAELRGELPGILFLVPGYGSQGGTSKD